jgi:hypothetical protein
MFDLIDTESKSQLLKSYTVTFEMRSYSVSGDSIEIVCPAIEECQDQFQFQLHHGFVPKEGTKPRDSVKNVMCARLKL